MVHYVQIKGEVRRTCMSACKIYFDADDLGPLLISLYQILCATHRDIITRYYANQAVIGGPNPYLFASVGVAQSHMTSNHSSEVVCRVPI